MVDALRRLDVSAQAHAAVGPARRLRAEHLARYRCRRDRRLEERGRALGESPRDSILAVHRLVRCSLLAALATFTLIVAGPAAPRPQTPADTARSMPRPSQGDPAPTDAARDPL